MAITRSLLNLGLGMAGGCIAFFVTGILQKEPIKSAQPLEVVSPAAVRPVTMVNSSAINNVPAGNVDLRDAAKKTVPARSPCQNDTDGKGDSGESFVGIFLR